MRDFTRPFSGALAKMTRERDEAITTSDSRVRDDTCRGPS
jgi:hypothetical protein